MIRHLVALAALSSATILAACGPAGFVGNLVVFSHSLSYLDSLTSYSDQRPVYATFHNNLPGNITGQVRRYSKADPLCC